MRLVYPPMEDDWDGLIDALLTSDDRDAEIQQHPPPQPPEGNALDDFEDLIAEVSGQQPGAHHASSEAEASIVANESHEEPVSMYGKLTELANIGTNMHQQLFSAFKASFQQRKQAPKRERHRDLYGKVVRSQRLLSVAALAEATEIADSTARLEIARLACVLLYGAFFLVGCFLHCLCKLCGERRQDRYKAIAVLSHSKYDETPLRLNVSDWKQFVGSDAPDHVKRERKVWRKGLPHYETYCQTKVLCISWQYGYEAALQYPIQ